jgi:hypothetical protein
VSNATNQVLARFYEEETTRASQHVVPGWVKRLGRSGSLDLDRDSIYRCEGLPRIAEPLAGQAPQTQGGRAMAHLAAKLSLATPARKPPAVWSG